jgi:hypothetical protein
LFCRRLPVWGCCGGGGSRLGGLQAELDRRLVGGSSEASQEVANLLLAGVDDLPGRGPVDGVGDAPAELLELATQLLHEGLGGKLRLAVHGFFLGLGLAAGTARLGRAFAASPPRHMASRKICHAPRNGWPNCRSRSGGRRGKLTDWGGPALVEAGHPTCDLEGNMAGRSRHPASSPPRIRGFGRTDFGVGLDVGEPGRRGRG